MFREFGCEEYFTSSTFRRGVIVAECQTPVVYPASQLRVLPELHFLAIGSAGADGIEFGYRVGHLGLWALHPYEQEFQFVASSIPELVEGWRSGAISV